MKIMYSMLSIYQLRGGRTKPLSKCVFLIFFNLVQKLVTYERSYCKQRQTVFLHCRWFSVLVLFPICLQRLFLVPTECGIVFVKFGIFFSFLTVFLSFLGRSRLPMTDRKISFIINNYVIIVCEKQLHGIFIIFCRHKKLYAHIHNHCMV